MDPHTVERAEERGSNEAEIREVIESGFPLPARHGRWRKAKVYPFNRRRRNQYYEHKRVEVIYVVEEDEIITVTVYVFYGFWEQDDADSIQR